MLDELKRLRRVYSWETHTLTQLLYQISQAPDRLNGVTAQLNEATVMLCCYEVHISNLTHLKSSSIIDWNEVGGFGVAVGKESLISAITSVIVMLGLFSSPPASHIQTSPEEKSFHTHTGCN